MENSSDLILFGIFMFLVILEWIFIKVDKRTGIGRKVKLIFHTISIILLVIVVLLWFL